MRALRFRGELRSSFLTTVQREVRFMRLSHLTVWILHLKKRDGEAGQLARRELRCCSSCLPARLPADKHEPALCFWKVYSDYLSAILLRGVSCTHLFQLFASFTSVLVSAVSWSLNRFMTYRSSHPQKYCVYMHSGSGNFWMLSPRQWWDNKNENSQTDVPLSSL